MKPFTTIAIVIFALVAILHLLRLCLGWEFTISGRVIPLWPSILGLIVAGTLSIGLWRESRNK
ncbi:MAG: hypothetical protein HYV35_11930 [Lentisphaerae bacterium]|nr:hypothetical protein [Lentisphaerota bacterium]